MRLSGTCFSVLALFYLTQWLSYIHVVANDKVSFFLQLSNSPPSMGMTFSLPIDQWMDTWVLPFLGYCGQCWKTHREQTPLQQDDLIAPGYVPSSRVASSYFCSWKNFHTVFHIDCPNLHSHLFPKPCQYSYFLSFTVTLTGVRWHLIVTFWFVDYWKWFSFVVTLIHSE